MQTIKRQAELETVCILALIGKEKTEIKRIEQELEKAGVRDKCIIIAEPAKSTAARITLVPFTAMAVAEFWRDRGIDSLLVIDDLSHHAVRYREMKLLSDAIPGRDSYPSDIFYLHARLLERAGNFLVNKKPVSITCLPVVNTVDSDISGYIETNTMSMTDGHLFFDKNLFFDGSRPAVNVFLSVTRVGKQTQSWLAKEVNQKIMDVMTEYLDLKRFLRFGSELNQHVRETIDLAGFLKQFFVQTGNVAIHIDVQLWLVAYLWANLWDGKNSEVLAEKLQTNKNALKEIKQIISKVKSFEELIKEVKKNKLVNSLLKDKK
jgi:F-type H+-transporting ATPase subunit alpha